MTPTAALMPDGKRLHLQHGPIDLIIGAEGDRDLAFHAAQDRFATVLHELVAELPLLRSQMRGTSSLPSGAIANRMHAAVQPFCDQTFVTSMAAVAGSVADTVLEAMCNSATLERAYVNNGGDIAIHLEAGATFKMAMAGHDGADLGRIEVRSTDTVRGIATSGRHGRSLSRGIADSVTVLAKTAAAADVAATLIANQVDLPGHPAISRKPAHAVTDDSDLGALPVVTACDPLPQADVDTALQSGMAFANETQHRGLIESASLFLQGQSCTTGPHPILSEQRIPLHA